MISPSEGSEWWGLPQKENSRSERFSSAPSAEKELVELLATGNAQARCYALVALHRLNPNAYTNRVRQFEHDQTDVSLIGGCIVTHEPMSSVVVNISNGRYDAYLKRK